MAITDSLDAATLAQNTLTAQITAERAAVLASIPTEAQAADVLAALSDVMFVSPKMLSAALTNVNLPTSLTGAALKTALSALFSGTNAASGYVKLSGGVILQWGSFSGITNVTYTAGGVYESAPIAVTWPIAFPNGIFQVVTSSATDVPGPGQQEQAWIGPAPSLSGATALVACRTSNMLMTGSYLAIGY